MSYSGSPTPCLSVEAPTALALAPQPTKFAAGVEGLLSLTIITKRIRIIYEAPPRHTATWPTRRHSLQWFFVIEATILHLFTDFKRRFLRFAGVCLNFLDVTETNNITGRQRIKVAEESDGSCTVGGGSGWPMRRETLKREIGL